MYVHVERVKLVEVWTNLHHLIKGCNVGIGGVL